MNLNFTHKNEYELNKKLIDELTRTFGIEAKLIVCEKNHIDKNVWGDWDSINTKNADVHCIHLLPENSDDIESQFPFGDFGFNTFDTSNVFMSAYEFESNKFTTEILLSSLVVFPSNKVMEITNVEHRVPGINNLWSYSDAKSAYKLTLRTYEFKLHDEIDGTAMASFEMDPSDAFSKEFSDESDDSPDSDDSIDPKDSLKKAFEEKKENYDALDNYFDKLLKKKKDIEYESEIQETTAVSSNRAKETNGQYNRKYESVVKNDEKDPFGW